MKVISINKVRSYMPSKQEKLDEYVLKVNNGIKESAEEGRDNYALSFMIGESDIKYIGDISVLYQEEGYDTEVVKTDLATFLHIKW